MYTVVIIEDDPMITRLNRRYVEQDSRFAVVQTFSAAHPALFWLQHNPIDLIILDVYMPQMSGTELLLQLRAKGVDADVIMVTSANDAKTVNDAVRLGAVDYLVKPFAEGEIDALTDELLARVPQPEKFMELPPQGKRAARQLQSGCARSHAVPADGAGAVCCSPEGPAKPDSCADRDLSARRAGRAAHER